jgi:hypothetical protein
MSNVISFPGRRPAPIQKPIPPVQKQSLANIGFANSLVGQTLLFYARQGFDHGERAQVALQAVVSSLD